LLDALLATIGCTNDIGDAIGIVENSPSLVVVTRRGDRLAPSGWRLGAAEDVGSVELIEEAERELGEATSDLARIAQAVESARNELIESRTAIADTQTRIERQL
jgi:chromosome segregation ATPase